MKRILTLMSELIIMLLAGKTEAGSAEEQLARDSRPGKRRSLAAGAARTGRSCAHQITFADAPDASEKLGSPPESHPLKRETDLSISRRIRTVKACADAIS